jgi:hypothetical protein
VWNTLPSYIRDTTKSIESFKTLLRKHYKDLTDSVFNPDDPRTLKSVCVKCHTSRPLWNLLSRSCCWVNRTLSSDPLLRVPNAITIMLMNITYLMVQLHVPV